MHALHLVFNDTLGYRLDGKMRTFGGMAVDRQGRSGGCWGGLWNAKNERSY